MGEWGPGGGEEREKERERLKKAFFMSRTFYIIAGPCVRGSEEEEVDKYKKNR